MNTAIDLVGRVVATEKFPNTAQSFSFWTNLDSPVGIGTIIRVESDKVYFNEKENKEYRRVVYGIVTEGISYTDLDSPLNDYISSDYDPIASRTAQTERPEIRYYTASVLKMEPEEPIQPVPIGNVHLATDKCVEKSLRMEKYKDSQLPVGLYINGDNKSPVYLDSKFLLGPEAAHLNVTGVSGLATKTSIIEFLLSSIMQKYNNEKIATVLFNVKGYDLLFVDQPAENLSEDELEMYDKLGMEVKAFENVKYYAPYKEDGYNLNTYRTNEHLLHNVYPLTWGLEQIFDHVQVLLNKDDIDSKADAFLSMIKENVINKKPNPNYLAFEPVKTFTDLENWFQRVFAEIEGQDQGSEGKTQWKSHATATIRKVYNRLMNIKTRCKGLVSNSSEPRDLFDEPFEDNGVYVVDVANIIPLAQDLVFTRIVEELKTRLEEKTLGVDKVIVFVDELNKYASSDSGNSYLKQTLLEISERGRYLGLILFSAQQFKSQVHKRIVGNCGTSVYGRMDMDELAQSGYSVMPSTIKAELTVLEKGKLLIRHPHFNQYIFVKFPRPPVMTSQDGAKKFPTAKDKEFDDAMVDWFKRLDPAIKANDIKDTIYGMDREEVIRALNETERKCSHDYLTYFKKTRKTNAKRESFAAAHSPAPASASIDDWLSE